MIFDIWRHRRRRRRRRCCRHCSTSATTAHAATSAVRHDRLRHDGGQAKAEHGHEGRDEQHDDQGENARGEVAPLAVVVAALVVIVVFCVVVLAVGFAATLGRLVRRAHADRHRARSLTARLADEHAIGRTLHRPHAQRAVRGQLVLAACGCRSVCVRCCVCGIAVSIVPWHFSARSLVVALSRNHRTSFVCLFVFG